ncbi:MAG TPA: hypothetical protein PK014_07120 [Thermoanaerobaculia bacterium]|nr:hypothetical protein [Thermoanaerobaculia bacterium]HUM29788.1 hypothetical protein [Thermoanaerobaculia bacterium]HXK68063.1 hypothetical protein [Thermoanaerobaculia bacterium]
MTKDDSRTRSSEHLFRCRGCGAQFAFDPASGTLTCPFCAQQQVIDSPDGANIEELDFEDFLSKEETQETVEAQTIQCRACGASSTHDPKLTSLSCPFCGTHIVEEGKTQKLIQPRSLLPFKVTRDQAVKSFRTWLRGLWFAPSRLKRDVHYPQALQGLYTPFWTYDADTTSLYKGQRGDDYWENESYSTTEGGRTVHKTRRVRKTRWSSVSGTVRKAFNDTLVPASRSLPERLAWKLTTWNLNQLVPFSPDYLSGFKAETYTVTLSEGFDQAREVMDGAIREAIRNDIGGDHQRIQDVKTRYDDVTFKHILLPIWISSYKFGEKVYRFLVNGQTAEIRAERPWSWVKIAGAVLFVIAVILLIFAVTGAFK